MRGLRSLICREGEGFRWKEKGAPEVSAEVVVASPGAAVRNGRLDVGEGGPGLVSIEERREDTLFSEFQVQMETFWL